MNHRPEDESHSDSSLPRHGVWLLYVLLSIFVLTLLAGLGAIAISAYSTFFAPAIVSEPTPMPTSTSVPPTAVTTTTMALRVPWLINLSERQAQLLLEDRGLIYEREGTDFSDAIGAGMIMRQHPSSGKDIDPGETVFVVISKGSAMVEVPEVMGEFRDRAVQLLSQAGLNASEMGRYTGDVPKGKVFAQSPGAGTTVAQGSTITLTVSLGVGLIKVPDVVGLDLSTAKATLRNSGLTPSPWDNWQGHDDLPDVLLRRVCVGCVLSTNPPGGAMVSLRTEVKLAVRKD